VKVIHRTTLDMPVDLNEAVNAAVKRTNLSKAQYMRMAIEVMNMLAGQDAEAFLRMADGTERQLLIPGVLR
jgi:hypothetical protein